MICYFLAQDILLETGTCPFLHQELPSVGSMCISASYSSLRKRNVT